MGWIVLLVPFLLFLAYYAVGGVGGMVGRLPSAEPPRPPMPGGPQIGTTTSLPRRGAGAGFSRADRLAEIDAFYGNDLNPIGLRMADLVPTVIPADSLRRMGEATGRRLRADKRDEDIPADVEHEITSYVEQRAVTALRGTVLSRTLRDLQDAERAGLRLADMLEVLGVLSPADVLGIRLPIVWNDGKCLVETIPAFGHADRMQELRNAVGAIVTGHGGQIGMALERVNDALRRALSSPSVAKEDKAVLERYLFAGARWLTSAEVPAYIQPRGTGSPTELTLGAFDDGRELLFDMAESLVTIASPGSGKSQAHVLRNLLRYRGGGVVLDIKGEMFEKSAAWRNTLGTVARFAPGDPASVSFNPLDWISADTRLAWDDAERLAAFLYVPPDVPSPDAYFETRATSLIRVALTFIKRWSAPEHQTMYDVVTFLYRLANEDYRRQWFTALVEREGGQDAFGRLSPLALEAEVLVNLPDRQREGVVDGTRNMLSVWLSPEVSAVSATTTFDPAVLRQNGTLYLCVGDQDIERLASVIRCVIGIMMRSLMNAGADRAAPIVTFFLDEMPRLKRMDLIERMLDLGRGYGIRLWLFAQNLGQLRDRYRNADGMLKNCAARCYMNLDPEDAQRIAGLLGEREGLLDGRRKPLADHWELAGPEFEDKVLVFLRSGLPARLTKVMAYADPVCAARMAHTEESVPTSD